MHKHLPLGLTLLLLSGLVAAQGDAPAGQPFINRNPVFREGLPQAPPQPLDPRDSSSRPVALPDLEDRANVLQPASLPNPRASSATPAPVRRPPASAPVKAAAGVSR